MHVQLRHLRYFVAVAEDLNFRRAAERVYVSQPALSVQIAQLEELIGVALLVRDKRHVELTSEGKLLYSEARKIIRSVDRAITKVRHSANIQPLKVGMPNFHYFEVISRSLQAFSTNFPGVELEINEQDAMDMQAALLQKKIDVGFMTLPLPTEESEGLEWSVISSERLLICIPPSHSAYSRDTINAESVKGSTFFLTPRVHHPAWHDFIVKGFLDAGFDLDIQADVTSAQAQYSLVAAQRGICIALETSPIPRGLRALPLEPPIFDIPLAIVWHPDAGHPSTPRLVNSIVDLAKRRR